MAGKDREGAPKLGGLLQSSMSSILLASTPSLLPKWFLWKTFVNGLPKLESKEVKFLFFGLLLYTNVLLGESSLTRRNHTRVHRKFACEFLHAVSTGRQPSAFLIWAWAHSCSFKFDKTYRENKRHDKREKVHRKVVRRAMIHGA